MTSPFIRIYFFLLKIATWRSTDFPSVISSRVSELNSELIEFAAESLDRFQRELVLLIEITRDDETTFVIQFSQGLIVNFFPGLCAIPVVLVAHEYEVEVFSQFRVLIQLACVSSEEFALASAGAVFQIPLSAEASLGVFDFPRPDIHSRETNFPVFVATEVSDEVG